MNGDQGGSIAKTRPQGRLDSARRPTAPRQGEEGSRGLKRSPTLPRDWGDPCPPPSQPPAGGSVFTNASSAAASPAGRARRGCGPRPRAPPAPYWARDQARSRSGPSAAGSPASPRLPGKGTSEGWSRGRLGQRPRRRRPATRPQPERSPSPGGRDAGGWGGGAAETRQKPERAGPGGVGPAVGGKGGGSRPPGGVKMRKKCRPLTFPNPWL